MITNVYELIGIISSLIVLGAIAITIIICDNKRVLKSKSELKEIQEDLKLIFELLFPKVDEKKDGVNK